MPNFRGPNRNGDVLPELTPEMFLSYGAMRELEGAVASRGPYSMSSRVAQLEEAGFPDDIPPTPVETFDVSFDTSELEDIEVDRPFRAPAQGARFNVLRPPAHEPFRPPPPIPGPQGGNMREVGRVGRFQILSDAAPEAATPDYLAEARARLEDNRFNSEARTNRRAALEQTHLGGQLSRVWKGVSNSEQAAQRAIIHKTLPTAYDRLMGDDPYEDDLE